LGLGYFSPHAARKGVRVDFLRGRHTFAEALRAATNGGWALGGARFRRQIAKARDRRVVPLSKGRPPSRKPDRRQLSLL
jgi:hypothetical protein